MEYQDISNKKNTTGNNQKENDNFEEIKFYNRYALFDDIDFNYSDADNEDLSQKINNEGISSFVEAEKIELGFSRKNEYEGLNSSVEDEKLYLGIKHKLPNNLDFENDNNDSNVMLHKKKKFNLNINISKEKKNKLLTDSDNFREEVNQFSSHENLKDCSEPNQKKQIKTIEQIIYVNSKQEKINIKDGFDKNNTYISKNNEDKTNDTDSRGSTLNTSNNIKIINIEDDIINYKIKIHEIIENDTLEINQKEYIKQLISNIKNINAIDMINILLINGKLDKLEIILDLDNTCIFSIVEESDSSNFANIKNSIKNKDIKLTSFSFNNKIYNCATLIRKGLKEFINFVIYIRC